jgi:uncharacterized protein
VVPLSQFVLKVHSRCDLACDHCYVYEAADQSWRGRPAAISDAVTVQAARRIAEHAAAHRLGSVQVVLHGGEPLLAGRTRLQRVITELHSALRGVCGLDLRIHTNGVLLNENFCELFAEYAVRVGISIDGDRAANDRHRRYADGRSSYDKVIRAIGLLRSRRFRNLYAGLLCTIDIANDPLAVYQSLMDLRPPRIDLLLPHATWDHPPARTPAAGSKYADWLIAIYDRWVADGRPAQIRTFDSVLSTLRGGGSFTEALGLEPTGLAVIETDGSYEQVDSLKAAFDGAPETGTNVFDHALDAVAAHPGILARQQGIAGLSQTCQDCPVVSSCGGGLYTHRYRTGSGFANPSVYCPDLLKLISHIGSHLPRQPAGRPANPLHAISSENLRALAAGFGDEGAMKQLIEAQRSLMRALLSAVYQAAITSPDVSAAAGTQLRSAWSLLTALDRDQPRALDAVLGHPYLRVWAARCLDQLRPAAGRPDDENQPLGGPGPPADLGHLGVIAAAAAMTARTTGTVTIPVTDGAVTLPTFGRLIISPDQPGRHFGRLAAPPELATVEVTGDEVRVRVGDSSWTLASTHLTSDLASALVMASTLRPARWQAVRKLTAPGVRVWLDDIDPYRDCYRQQAAPRLADAEYARWRRQFPQAWQEIEREHAAYAPALAAGLTTLTPLAAGPHDRNANVAIGPAFGAIGVALPAGLADLALRVIQEFQQVKLGGVLDLFDLFDPADDRLFHSPWRDDKHHLKGLLQDTYAHLAVTDFWRVRHQDAAGQEAEAAGPEFARGRALTRDAIETLRSSGLLTPRGAWFVEEMRHSLSP